jgi:hypothetical protein
LNRGFQGFLIQLIESGHILRGKPFPIGFDRHFYEGMSKLPLQASRRFTMLRRMFQ